MRESVSFTITRLQYLTTDGHCDTPLPDWLTPDLLIDAYKTLLRVRTFDTKTIALQRTGKLGTYASVLGQEAISTAIGLTMSPEDVLAPYYRDTGAQLLRGVRMEELLAYWGGDERGSAYVECPNDFPICVPIATQVAHGAGAAAALKIRGVKAASVTTCGDGATSKGDFLESLNLVGAWQLPLVIVVNNNQWAISVPREHQCHAPTLAQKAIAAGIPGVQVDGNDMIGLLVALRESLERAHHGKGGTLIEAVTYRLCDHTTADDASRYRPAEEVDHAWAAEPVARLRRYLESRHLWNDEQENAWLAECKTEVDAAVARYLALEPEPPEAMFDHLYAELPATYQSQRSELASRHPSPLG